MTQILAALKSKGLTLLCVVLATLLTVSYLSGESNKKALDSAEKKLLEHVSLNKRLSDQNLALAEEIKNKPAEYITITKDVEKEVCNGLVKQTMIHSIPSKKKEVVDEIVTQEPSTADIDDRLPDDLIKLLQ